MSQSKKLVREFKGALTGALAGFLYRSLRGEKSRANKIKNQASQMAPSVAKEFEKLEKIVNKSKADAQKAISKLPPEKRAEIERMTKHFESKHIK